jgi:hypothetical protein
LHPSARRFVHVREMAAQHEIETAAGVAAIGGHKSVHVKKR